MKILFSPSESKNEISTLNPIDNTSFIFPELFIKRLEVIEHFNNFIIHANHENLTEFFGLKKENDIKKFQQNPLTSPTIAAIQRYNGVSYEYLNFHTLNSQAQEYILKNTIIFSNLFGPILAANPIPLYKLKQGAKLPNFNIENFYKIHFTKTLDQFLENDEILDLRANFYEKFYSPKQKFTSYKFIKNGKIVSHFAKAYRGILLRILAQNQINSNGDLLRLLPPNLKLKEIQKKALKQEIILEIL